jgi:hypothetical protein
MLEVPLPKDVKSILQVLLLIKLSRPLEHQLLLKNFSIMEAILEIELEITEILARMLVLSTQEQMLEELATLMLIQMDIIMLVMIIVMEVLLLVYRQQLHI